MHMDPTRTDAEASSPDLLFIVKTERSSSVSRNSPEELRQIQRHAQTTRFSRRHVQRSQYRVPRASLPEDREDQPSHAGHSSDHPRHSSQTQERRPLSVHHETDALEVRTKTATRSIPQMPTSEEQVIDPFACASVPVDREVHTLLRYYVEICHPDVWNTEHCLVPSKQYLYQYTLDSIITDCMRETVNMYAMLASMASRAAFLHRVALQHEIGYFLHKAIIALRMHVAQSSTFTDRTIFNMFHLACAEFYRYSNNAGLVHLRAIKEAVEARGGIVTIAPALRELIILGDCHVAAETLSNPILDMRHFEAAHSMPPAIVPVYISTLDGIRSGQYAVASAFFSPRCESFMPAQLGREVMDLAVSLELLKSFSYDYDDPHLRTEILHWLHIRNLSVRHRLLRMELDDPRSNLIRFTIVAWTLLTMSGAGRIRIARIMARRLQQGFSMTMRYDQWTDILDVRLWILLVLELCATAGSVEQLWYLSKLQAARASVRCTRGPASWDVPGLMKFCEDFFLLREVQGPMFAELVSLMNDQE